MTLITNLLFWISTGLLVPVIVLLLFFFLRSLLLVGGFFGQYLAVRKSEGQLDALLSPLTPNDLASLTEQLPHIPGVAAPFYAQLLAVRHSAAHRERVLSAFDDAAHRAIALPRTLTKMGPVLGLMGTLIPMGPALVGLSAGDIASMAYNMQVAFATTVVGLVIGAIGTLTLQVQKRWNAQHMAHLEFLAALAEEAQTTPHSTAVSTAKPVEQ